MEFLSIESTKNILEKSDNLFEEKNKKFYRDVVDFLNLMFEDNSKELTKIKFKKITLNENVFNLYNQIIIKYKLDKPEFISDNFDISNIEDPVEIKKIFCDLAIKLSNNILDKLNYKLKKRIIKNENKIKIILEYNK